MKFGVREICNVVFRAKDTQTIGGKEYAKGQPVLYIDSATTSTVEGAATTVYAKGGRGNTNLVAWEGEKTLTFTVEDALLSPISFSMLSGAGLLKGESTEKVHVHMTTAAYISDKGVIDLSSALKQANADEICATAPMFVLGLDEFGDLNGVIYEGTVSSTSDPTTKKTVAKKTIEMDGDATEIKGKNVLVDYYVLKKADSVSELQIDAENFAGYYYVEADTLFRRQKDGVDLPANITFPNVKIQSNFTFNMAATGDPSTFSFTMDAFPGYTYFNETKQVLCAIQIIEDSVNGTVDAVSLFGEKSGETFAESTNDSSKQVGNRTTSGNASQG